jgi:hypothetical protein
MFRLFFKGIRKPFGLAVFWLFFGAQPILAEALLFSHPFYDR